MDEHLKQPPESTGYVNIEDTLCLGGEGSHQKGDVSMESPEAVGANPGSSSRKQKKSPRWPGSRRLAIQAAKMASVYLDETFATRVGKGFFSKS